MCGLDDSVDTARMKCLNWGAGRSLDVDNSIVRSTSTLLGRIADVATGRSALHWNAVTKIWSYCRVEL